MMLNAYFQEGATEGRSATMRLLDLFIERGQPKGITALLSSKNSCLT